jgi:spore coat protein H
MRLLQDMRATLVLLAVSAFLACSDGKSGGAPGADGGAGLDGGAIANPCSPADPTLATTTADALFGAATIPVFDLTLPTASWQWLKEHAQEEEYVEAEACYNGQSVGKVGMRFKGSYGSLYTCFNDAGVSSCRKIGIKLKFDEYVEKQRFFGLKRINFQGYRWDDSYLKERLSYDLFRSMGIVAPRAAWAQVRVNGEMQGLFGMVEQIDGPFTKDRFPLNGDNNLYKEAWPGSSDDEFLISRLETNKDTPNIAAFKAFSQALHAAPETAIRPTLAQYMDLGYFARYMAVDDAVANFDGVITYYTNGTLDEAGNHNFFFYEESPQRYTIIPWDLESTLSLASNYGYVPPWQKLPADCTQHFPVWGGQNQVIAPGCDRVFRGLAEDLTEYRAAARLLLDSYFTVERMNANIDTFAAFIRAAAIADPHGPGQTNFENGVGYLKQDMPRLRARLEHLLSGQDTILLALATVGVNDFEALDNYSLIAGGAQMSNGHTTASVELNLTTPISGTQSCRVIFNFGNETKSYQQWTWYKMSMATQPADFSRLTGVRLKARSNVARTLRLDIDSPNYSAANEGIQFGWELPVGPTAKTFEVRFAEAKYPSWARDPGDSLTTILQTANALMFQPLCVARDSSGQIPDGVTDNGWLDMDDIEFF